MTLNEIRQQLKAIRLYHTSKARFSAAFETLPHNVTQLGGHRYAAMVNSAPLDLYLVYYELYVKGLTQEATPRQTSITARSTFGRRTNGCCCSCNKKSTIKGVNRLKEIELRNNPLGHQGLCRRGA